MLQALTVGLWLLAAPASVVEAWDVPGLLQAVEMPGVVVSHGIPVRIRAARSSWRVEALAQYYMDRFLEAGLYVPPEGHVTETTTSPQLTALDPDRMIAYTVIFQIHPDRTTTVIQTSANLALRQQVAQGVDFAPLYPGARRVMQSTVEGMRSVVYAVSAPAPQVIEFYRTTLKKAGYAERDAGDFLRGEQLLRVRALPEPGETVVSVMQLTGGQPASLRP